MPSNCPVEGGHFEARKDDGSSSIWKVRRLFGGIHYIRISLETALGKITTRPSAVDHCDNRMFRRRQQRKIFLCFYCNTPSTLQVSPSQPLRKWYCQNCEQTNHLDEVAALSRPLPPSFRVLLPDVLLRFACLSTDRPLKGLATNMTRTAK